MKMSETLITNDGSSGHPFTENVEQYTMELGGELDVPTAKVVILTTYLLIA